MHSIIVVPPGCSGPAGQLRIAPGQSLAFGRAAENDLVIAHPGVSRTAGTITAHHSFRILSNDSSSQTYVVENPEGAGEHVKIAPGRQDSPIPFEFARVVLPAAHDLLGFEVWAPSHSYRRRAVGDGPATAPAFAPDRTKRYFAVLTALCEPRLRGAPHAPLPTVDELSSGCAPPGPPPTRPPSTGTWTTWPSNSASVPNRTPPGRAGASAVRRSPWPRSRCASTWSAKTI